MDFFLLLVLLVICFAVAFAIGSNDETMSPAVGAKIFSIRLAVLIGGIINIVGAISLGGGVSEKVGSELVYGISLTTSMVFAILMSMAIWLLLASATKGLPISTTQCIVGAVIGVVAGSPLLGIDGWGISVINWFVVFEIFAGWILSPIIGFLIAGLVFSLVRRLQKRAFGLEARERHERIAAYGLAIFLIITGLSRGGNDVANAVSPLLALEEFRGMIVIGWFYLEAFYIPLIVGGLGMAIGLAIVGRKVITVLSTEVVTLSPSSALSASISVSLVLFVGTYMGLPLSGTHILVAALIAVGWVSREPVQKKQVRDIVISWIITVPISALLGFVVLVFTNFVL